MAEELIAFPSKAEMLARSRQFWNPDKTQFWADSGVPLVIDRREGYFIYDVGGKRLIDVHLNGGTYNLGHRNPEVTAAVSAAMQRFDIGNHHFPSLARTALAEALISTAPPGLAKVVFGSGGGEAIDIALKTARHATKKRRIVSVAKAYHGHTGLAVATGDERFATLFLADRPDEFTHVPFNDLAAMEDALRGRDVAAVIMETIPATYGFPLPAPGYLEGTKALCERYGALYIADEVQTGLMRTGELWAITKHGIAPDILVTGKGISGGMYPISAVLVSEAAAGWLSEDGFAHMSTFGGAELGCIAALKTLEITCRPEVRSMVFYIADLIGRGLRRIQSAYPDWFAGIRQDGLVMGLEFDHPQGAKFVMKRLYEHGVWAIFSTLDPRVLQFKPGLLLTPDLCAELLDRVEVAIAAARNDAAASPGGDPRDEQGAVMTDAATDEPISIDLLTDPAGVPRARAMLQRAQWAASAFARYDRAAVDRIVHAAAAAGAAKAREYADWAVRETGFGVAEHKVIKNLASSTGLIEAYAGHDYVTPRVDPAARLVEIPRPAGVVLALTPSTNPVATVFVKSLLALMTRNAVVVSPHPLARECSADAARTLAQAAVAAGAPDGVIQVVDEPSVPLINALMADERTSVIVATGGTGVVRAAYSSGTPAIGVGPGNVPVFVADDADLPEAAQRIVDSKSFDNSILCTNESVLIVTEAAAGALLRHLQRAGAYLLPPDERDRVRDLLFPGGHFDTRFVGKDATWIAAQAGLRVPGTTRILLAPFPLVVPEEPLAHEKLCPVLGLTRVGSVRHGIDAARAVLRLGGRGHSAAIHAADPATIMAYGAALEVLRIVVNAGSSLGSAGVGTGLAPSMTIGTGFFGRSSVGENLQPKHLVQWTRLAYNEDPAVGFADFTGLVPWEAPAGAVPPYPVASNLRDDGGRPWPGHSSPAITPGKNAPASAAGPARPATGLVGADADPDLAALRVEIRRVVLEELRSILGDRDG